MIVRAATRSPRMRDIIYANFGGLEHLFQTSKVSVYDIYQLCGVWSSQQRAWCATRDLTWQEMDEWMAAEVARKAEADSAMPSTTPPACG